MTIKLGSLEVGPGDRIRWRGRPVELRPMERRLLAHLARHPDRVHTRAALLDSVWGAAVGQRGERLGRTVDVHVARVRRALQGGEHALVTVRRVGYRLDSHVLNGGGQ